ncbi:AbrB family transcriptional regulator [Corynebacterium auriscanis]|uniref:AbrB family transcriptional regulator n=1 Tax=Corynebacterium auriscanis TaxID=99807 RepID=UPI001F2E7FCF|nr:AbrB family transcriptional regulator [Corynebacterium auriscanis]WJY72271.1 Putative ammonia monooxygenase [Corynebacterium auriscanis]
MYSGLIKATRPKSTPLWHLGVLTGVSVLGALLGQRIGVPAAFIFSFLLVFGCYAIFADRQITPPKKVMTPAQVVIALLCSAPLTTLPTSQIAHYALPTTLSLVVTFIVCGFAAWSLVRVNRQSPATSVLATLAGGASAMVMLSRELNADTRFVTLTQYLRLSVVVFTLPAFVSLLSGLGDSSAGISGASGKKDAIAGLATSWQGLMGCVVAGLTVWAFTKVTAGWFTVSSPYLLLTIAFSVVAVKLLGVPGEFITPTGVLVDAAYAIIGVQAGGTLTKGALRQFAQALPVIFGVIALMIGSSLAAAWVIATVWGDTLLDAYLATVPGGVYAVLAFAHESGGDPLVTVVQVMRVIAMLVVGAYAPQIVSFISRRHAAPPPRS